MRRKAYRERSTITDIVQYAVEMMLAADAAASKRENAQRVGGAA